MKWVTRIFRRKRRSQEPRREQDVPAPAQPVSAEGTAKGTYSPDEPIKSKDADRFGRWNFAKRIGDTIAKRFDPSSLVIGLYGPWGDGKTSTLRLMEEALKDHAHVVVVRFNPWNFGSEQQLLRGFFDSLAEGIGRSLGTRKEEIGNLLEKYGSILTVASMTIGAAVQISPGEAIQGLGKALSTVELDELRQRLENLLRDSGKRVVVLIDDIDRLDREEAHAMLKLVKLSAGFSYTSYVLAFDDEVVAAAIGERYGAGDAASGRRFLEKIVQVPLHLPPPDEIELRRMAFDGVDVALTLSETTLPQDQIDAFFRHFVDGLEPQLRTPRQANLYRNALTFALPLLKGETYTVDALLIEGIRVFYPKLYTTIRDNPDRFLRAARDNAARQRTDALVDGALEGIGPQEKEAVKGRLLPALFPRIGTMGYGSEWDLRWAAERRICSDEYFQRYFTYSVPLRDISDSEITSLVDDLRDARISPEEADAKFQSIADRGAMEKTVHKLRRREDQLDAPAARGVALAVVRNGALFPNRRALFSHTEPFAQAAILAAHLLKRIPDNRERELLAQQMLDRAEPLSFAFEYFQWLRRGEGTPENERVVSEAAETEVGRRLAKRIKAKAAESPLYRLFGEVAPALYWAWRTYGDAGDLTEHLRSGLNTEPAQADEFLDGFVGYSWGMETGIPRRSDFDRSRYDAVATSLDPEFVLSKLRERHGAALDDSEFHQSDDIALPLRIARQFAFIHRKVKAEKPQPDTENAASKADSDSSNVDA